MSEEKCEMCPGCEGECVPAEWTDEDTIELGRYIDGLIEDYNEKAQGTDLPMIMAFLLDEEDKEDFIEGVIEGMSDDKGETTDE